MSTEKSVEKFNVVILYDHYSSVGRAMTAYSHLIRELESEFTSELRIWRIDVATLPEFAAQACDEIKSAELVIMAVRGSQPCPPAFLAWTEGAEGSVGLPKRALIAIIEKADEVALAGTWSSVLRDSVAQNQRDVFLWSPADAPGDPPPSKN